MKPDSSKMTYRYLGKTGLRVSVIGWGNWVNNQNDELENLEVLHEYLDFLNSKNKAK